MSGWRRRGRKGGKVEKEARNTGKKGREGREESYGELVRNSDEGDEE